jgi:AsmA protein
MDRREPTFGAPRPKPTTEVQDTPPPRLRSLREARPARRRTSAWSRLGLALVYAGLAVVCVLAAGITFLLIAAPTDLVRDQIVAQVKARTGRTLTLTGPASFTLFPSIGVRLDGVTLSAPPGMQVAPLVTIKRLAADVGLRPLLQREVVIERLVLSEPVFEFHVDAQGRRSWDFAAGSESQADPLVRLAQATPRGTKNDTLPPELKDFVRNASDPSKAGQVANGGIAGLDELALVDTRIENGTARFHDYRSGVRHEARAITVEIGLRSLASPLEIKGKLDWQGEPMRIDARLSTLKAVLDGRAAKLTAAISGQPLEVSYDGRLAHRNSTEIDGSVSLKTASVRTLAQWLGTELPPSQGFGPATLAGVLRSNGSVHGLDAAVATFDGATANGTLSLDTSGPRPLVKANLRITEVMLDKYRESRSPEQRSAVPRTGTATPAAVQPPAAGQVQSIEDILLREGVAGPKVKGFSQRDGWSSEPLDLAGLSLLDADARLSFGRIASGELKIGSTQLLMELKSGALRLTIEDSLLYEGRAKGFVTLEGPTSAIVAANLQIDGMATQLLLKDAAGFDSLAGKGRISLALAGRGRSEKEIVESLAGKAELNVSDGAIVGWNIPQMIRGLGQGKFSGFDRVASERTDFSELAATFQIEAGVATNRDMRMTSPLLRMAGAGTIELPARRLDYTVKPKLVASLSGQGNAADASGFEIPVRIKGPWDRPSYEPDLQAVLGDPDKVADTVNQIGKQLGVKGNLGDVVRRALGGGDKGDQPAGSDAKKSGGVKQLLDQFLK